MSLIHYNKTVLIGNAGSGKTSLVHYLQFGKFNNDIASTIGTTYALHTMNIDGSNVKLHIWDTSGESRYNTLLPMFIRNSKIVLICVDEPNVSLVQIYEREIKNTDAFARIILVITKIDKLAHLISSRECIIEYALSKNMDIFFTSSTSGKGVHELFEEVGRHFIQIDTVSDDCDTELDLNQTTSERGFHRENVCRNVRGMFSRWCVML